MSERDEGPWCHNSDPAAEEPRGSVPAGPQTPAPAGAQGPAPTGPSASPPGGNPVADEDPLGFVPARVGCRSELRGWAGAHLHGAVRPRRRAPGRGRPPSRWC
jgi:hypothetical protein